MEGVASFSFPSLSQTGPPHPPCPGHLQGLRLPSLPEAMKSRPVEHKSLQSLDKVHKRKCRWAEQDQRLPLAGEHWPLRGKKLKALCFSGQKDAEISRPSVVSYPCTVQ